VARANPLVLCIEKRLKCRHNGALLRQLLLGELSWHLVGLHEERIHLSTPAYLFLKVAQETIDTQRGGCGALWTSTGDARDFVPLMPMISTMQAMAGTLQVSINTVWSRKIQG
jgi:hypothetical protein